MCNNEHMEQEFYSAKEFAVILRVSQWTVLRALKDGQIFGMKVNKTYRIPRSEIARLLAVEFAKHNTEE